MRAAGTFDLSKVEPYLTDTQVDRASYRVRSALGFRELQDSDFITFLVPKRRVPAQTAGGLAFEKEIPEMVVFGVISDNPRHKGHKLLTHATVSLEGWLEAENEPVDHAFNIFRRVAEKHLKLLDDYKQLIN